jgi:hypothetical protein
MSVPYRQIHGAKDDRVSAHQMPLISFHQRGTLDFGRGGRLSADA